MDFEIGFWGLFLACFLAATIIPFSSEAILSSMLVAGFDPFLTLLVATTGNWMGGMTSYGLGRMGKMEWIHKYLRIPPDQLMRIRHRIQGKEAWISLLCWLPFIGDIIAVALGWIRANFWLVLMGMLIGKAVRYAVWGLLTLKTMELMAAGYV